jgi:DNA-directed RNA polymerase specialized sigma24 family protein
MREKKSSDAVRDPTRTAPILVREAGADGHVSPDEALARLDGLTEKDFLALETASHKYRQWLAEDADELLGEAVQRLLDGRRKWPRGVELGPFLAEVMRSVAWEWLGKSRRRAIPESRLAAHEGDDAEDEESYIDRQPAPGPGADAPTKLGEIAERIETVFGDDDAITAILIGRVEGMSPAETQKTFDLTPDQYAAAQKKLRRAVLAGRLDDLT